MAAEEAAAAEVGEGVTGAEGVVESVGGAVEGAVTIEWSRGSDAGDVKGGGIKGGGIKGDSIKGGGIKEGGLKSESVQGGGVDSLSVNDGRRTSGGSRGGGSGGKKREVGGESGVGGVRKGRLSFENVYFGYDVSRGNVRNVSFEMRTIYINICILYI